MPPFYLSIRRLLIEREPVFPRNPHGNLYEPPRIDDNNEKMNHVTMVFNATRSGLFFPWKHRGSHKLLHELTY